LDLSCLPDLYSDFVEQNAAIFFFNEADTLVVIRLDEDSAVDGNLESRATVIFWTSAEKQT
jgi:hypothetical protein